MTQNAENILDIETHQEGTPLGMKPAYMETYRTGRFTPPSPDVIAAWLRHYNLTVLEFLNITGIDRRTYNRIIRGESKKGMEYGAVRTFLMWAGQVESERFNQNEETVEDQLRRFMKEHDLRLSDFTQKYLNFTPQRYYALKKSDQPRLTEMIKDALSSVA